MVLRALLGRLLPCPPGWGNGAGTVKDCLSPGAASRGGPCSERKAMKKTLGFTLSMVAAILLLAVLGSGPAASGAPAAPAKPDGKQIFLAQKCNLCHTVSSSGI